MGPGRIDAPEDLVPDLLGVRRVRADGRDIIQCGAKFDRVGPTLCLGPHHQATRSAEPPGKGDCLHKRRARVAVLATGPRAREFVVAQGLEGQIVKWKVLVISRQSHQPKV